jgi:hypothetical protein
MLLSIKLAPLFPVCADRALIDRICLIIRPRGTSLPEVEVLALVTCYNILVVIVTEIAAEVIKSPKAIRVLDRAI